ncbi:uncharacterized protein ARB_01051 [Trichophyton benhamiae CBS 112371]|uniref:TLDc domain-containing protein n=1 Tax=Arthroderma benhamiae (strain ATCC MYA-4681 / CBS 112371) TaxID=663331 RepID=D4AXY2_ARTBC|nr:uncharacterized protein ARB_01051 [Trichophyton benhamiae CBS 112371]EFE32160.1 hypothetical protein ARB_01051 [Trichophyton benhamiae CBS 112371]
MGPESDAEQLDKWISGGYMTPERILNRLTESSEYCGLRESEYIGLKEFFDRQGTEEAGIAYVDRDAFVSFLKGSSPVFSLFDEAGDILYSSVLYLSRYPFDLGTSRKMTLEQLARALIWALIDAPFNDLRARTLYDESNFCRGRTWADHRRAIFQSLATSRDGSTLPYNRKEWAEKARDRAYHFDKFDQSRLQFAAVNCDEDGDEMYHDVLDILFSSQIEIDPCFAPVARDSFRPLAKKLHGDNTHLHHLTIPRKSFHAFIKLLLVYQFGCNDRMEGDALADLDRVSSCITNAFARDSNIGITWPMFDDAYKVTPWLLDGYYRILSSLFGIPKEGERLGFDMENISTDLPSPTNILTFPVMAQLGIMFSRSSYSFYNLRLHRHYKPRLSEIRLSAVATDISATPGSAFFLVSGKNKETGDVCMFGAYIAVPSKDGGEIQSTEEEKVINWQDSCLFELSPVHDIYPGKVGSPGWTSTEDNLCFGNRANGVAFDIENDLRNATVSHTVDRKQEPVYNPSSWRGNWQMKLDIEEVELWVDEE